MSATSCAEMDEEMKNDWLKTGEERTVAGKIVVRRKAAKTCH